MNITRALIIFTIIYVCDASDLEDRGMRFWSIVVQIYEENLPLDRTGIWYAEVKLH